MSFVVAHSEDLPLGEAPGNGIEASMAALSAPQALERKSWN